MLYEVITSKVQVNDNFWLPKIETNRTATIPASFKKCEETGRLENFLIAGGKMEGEVRGDMPFDDTDVYKIIEGASYSMTTIPDPKLDAYVITSYSIHYTKLYDMLTGIFFEDINYAADGGLYAELVQNRGFEYQLSDRKGRDPSWNATKAWNLSGEGASFTIDTVAPVHPNT